MQEDSNGGVRYRLLETVRQYGLEKLKESGEWQAVCHRHHAYYLQLAQVASEHLLGASQLEWIRCLESEHDNVRSALNYCQQPASSPDESESRTMMALRLTAAMLRFWDVRGYFAEGRAWFAWALARPEAQSPTRERAKALNGAGTMAAMQGDYAAAGALQEEALAIHRALGNKHGIADSLAYLAQIATRQGRYDQAIALNDEVLAMARALGLAFREASALNNLGLIAMERRDWQQARELYEESLAISRAHGNYHLMAITLTNLGIVTHEHDRPAAKPYYLQAMQI